MKAKPHRLRDADEAASPSIYPLCPARSLCADSGPNIATFRAPVASGLEEMS